MTLSRLVLMAVAASSLFAVSANAQTPKHTLLAIFAHPDDERIVGPLLSRYAREGDRIVLVIATDGRKGVTPHAGIPAGDSLARLRAAEANCATRELGIGAPILLGLEDAGLASFAALGQLRDKLKVLFKEDRPDAIITFGPEGGTGHPDHRLVGDVVTELVEAGAEGAVQRLFFPSLPAERMQTAPAARPTINTMLAKYLTVKVAFEEQDFENASRSYACHATQYTPEQVLANMRYMDWGFQGAVHLRPWRAGGAPANTIFVP